MSDIENQEQKEKLRVLEATEAHKLVLETTQRMLNLMHDATDGISGRQRWLIQGRITNHIFARFFRVSLDALPKDVL